MSSNPSNRNTSDPSKEIENTAAITDTNTFIADVDVTDNLIIVMDPDVTSSDVAFDVTRIPSTTSAGEDRKERIVQHTIIFPTSIPAPPVPLRSIEELMAADAFEQTIHDLNSRDNVLIQAAAENIRRILSVEINIKMAIDAGLVFTLVNLLKNDLYPKIQYEASWALLLVASGKSEETRAVVDAGGCSELIRLASTSQSEDVREQSAWALGNIAGDSLEYRDKVLELGGLPALLSILNNENNRISTIRNTTRAMSNLFSCKPSPSYENIALALPSLARLIHSPDTKTVEDVKKALWKICDGAPDDIQMVVIQDFVPKLHEVLNSGGTKVSPDLVQAISSLLGNEKSSIIRNIACWAVSKITAGSKERIQALIDSGSVIPQLIDILTKAMSYGFEATREACRIVVNIITNGNEDQVIHVVNAGVISAMFDLLMASDDQVIDVVSQALDI